MSRLKGTRLLLRPIEKKDLMKLNEWKNKEDVYKYLGGGYLPVSMDIQEKWMDSLMDTTGDNKRFLMEEASGKCIGMVGLYRINWIHRTCELGILIGETGEQGKGYGKEACALIEDFALRFLNLRKIKVFVVAENQAAVRMYEKLGYEKAGELKEERFIDGSYHTLLLMERFLRGGGKSLPKTESSRSFIRQGRAA